MNLLKDMKLRRRETARVNEKYPPPHSAPPVSKSIRFNEMRPRASPRPPSPSASMYSDDSATIPEQASKAYEDKSVPARSHMEHTNHAKDRGAMRSSKPKLRVQTAVPPPADHEPPRSRSARSARSPPAQSADRARVLPAGSASNGRRSAMSEVNYAPLSPDIALSSQTWSRSTSPVVAAAVVGSSRTGRT